jgi:diaminopropionate ammonia-lyase
MEFHRSMPDYAVTPLRSLPELAATLGIGAFLLKDESLRLGLPAFKILGASWAIYSVLRREMAGSPRTLEELRESLALQKPRALVTASEGNHGRAVARMARLLGQPARIFLPRGTDPSRVEAIESEGAEVVSVPGDYDQAVAAAAREQGPECLVIQDQSFPGYEETPALVTEGYSTIFWEIEDQLAARNEPGPDLVAVQIGVGALASAVVVHYRRPGLSSQPGLVGVEPLGSACAMAAWQAGRVVTVPGPHDSIMAGLNCGMVGSNARPLLEALDGFAAVEDGRCREAVGLLAEAGLTIGASGAAGLAGLLELLAGPEPIRRALSLGRETRVLALATEAVTDCGSRAAVRRRS